MGADMRVPDSTVNSMNVNAADATSDAAPLSIKADTGHFCLKLQENSGGEAFRIGINSDGSFGIYNSADAISSPQLYIHDSNYVIIGGTPTGSCAKLEIISTTQGVLLPRMTSAQRGAIGTPLAGLMVFDTDLQQICIYVTGKWQKVTQTDA